MEIPVSTTLTPDQNDRLRIAVAKLVEKHGGQSAAAHACGLHQTWVSRMLSGGGGGTYRSAAIVARELGVNLAKMLGAPVYNPNALADVKGYKQALREARIRGAAYYTDTVWAAVGQMTLAPLEEVTADVLLMVAAIVQSERSKKLVSGSDLPPPSRPPGGGHRRSGSKLRKR